MNLPNSQPGTDANINLPKSTEAMRAIARRDAIAKLSKLGGLSASSVLLVLMSKRASAASYYMMN
jgi:hypothetical protein